MVKRTLTNINRLTRDLLFEVGSKITSGDISTINSDISKDLKIDYNEIQSLLNAIERKLKDCEIVFYTFFENVDNDAIAGNTSFATNIKTIEIEFNYSTTIIKNKLEINDHIAYKEIIDSNFQSFILLISSLYENLVRLTEIILRKIIVHTKKTPPLSSPYYLLLEYWDILISLDYRTKDNVYNSIDAHKQFLTDYTQTLNILRNRFIHGYSTILFSDTNSEYRIEKQTNNFTDSSPHLVLDIFTSHVLNNTISLITDFLSALISDLKTPGCKIPF